MNSTSCCSKNIFKYHLFDLNKKVSLPAFLLLSLFAGAQQAQAARAPINVDYEGKTYCIGFDNSVDFHWPGKGGGAGGQGLKPNQSNNGQTMGQWKYDNQPWWNGYTEANKNTNSLKAILAKSLSKEAVFDGNILFVWTTGSGNQPNGYVNGKNKDGYLGVNPAGSYNYFGSPNFTGTNEKSYIAYVESEGECVGDDGIVNIDGIIGELGDPD